MLRIARFGGLLTYASSYAVPPGGAVQQVNLTCSLPGQLTSRGGTVPVSYRGAKAVPTDVVTQLFTAPGGVGKGDRLVMIEADGTVTLSQSISGDP
jgi:hypothetical protein